MFDKNAPELSEAEATILRNEEMGDIFPYFALGNATSNLDAAKILQDLNLMLPAALLGAFSCELFLKCLLVLGGKKLKEVKTHKLFNLYDSLSTEFKNDIISLIHGITEVEFNEKLKCSSNTFVAIRYFNDKRAIEYDLGFVISFAETLYIVSSKKINVV